MKGGWFWFVAGLGLWRVGYFIIGVTIHVMNRSEFEGRNGGLRGVLFVIRKAEVPATYKRGGGSRAGTGFRVGTRP